MPPRARKGPRPASHGPCCWRRLSPGPVSRPRSLRWLQPHTPTLRTAKVYFSQNPLVYSSWQWGGVLPSLGPQGHLVAQGTWPQRTHCVCTEGATYPFCSHGPPSHARVQGTGVWADGSNDLHTGRGARAGDSHVFQMEAGAPSRCRGVDGATDAVQKRGAAAMTLGSAGAKDGGTLKRGGSWGWGGERRPERGPQGGRGPCGAQLPGPSGPEGPREALRVPQAVSRAVQAHPRGRFHPTPALTGGKSPVLWAELPGPSELKVQSRGTVSECAKGHTFNGPGRPPSRLLGEE